MGRSRIKDIAALAGVSVGTVDRVLHNRGEVAQATREKILQAVEELSYQPNLAARSLASNKTYTIALAIPKETDANPYWDAPLGGAQKAIAELKDFGFQLRTFFFQTTDTPSFLKATEKALMAKPDAVLFAPIFLRESQEFTLQLEAENIPYAVINTDIAMPNKLGYFGQDCYQSGRVAARLLTYGMQPESAYLVVHVARQAGNAQHLMEKETGFRDFIANFSPESTVHKIEDSSWHERGFQQALKMAIGQIPNLKGVFVTTSKVHEVVKALEKDGSHLRIVGYDLVRDNVRYLQEGKIDFLIGQKPEEQGYKATMALFNYLVQKKEPQKVNFVPIDIITADNLPFYLSGQ